MNRFFHVLGLLFLALLLFVGLIHVFLAVQGKDSPKTIETLHDVPVIGGFFWNLEPADEEIPPAGQQQDDVEAHIAPGDEIYDFPREYPRENVEAVVAAAKEERETYERLRAEVEQERDALLVLERDLEERYEELRARIRRVQEKADALVARELELQVRERLLKGSNRKAVKAMAASLEAMSEAQAAEALKEMMGRAGGGKELAAIVLMSITERKRGKILDAMAKGDAVDLMEVFRRLNSTPAAGDSDTGSDRTATAGN